MTPRPLDPRKISVAIDGNSLNRNGSASDALVDRLLQLSAAGTINLIIPKGVRGEILDPKTPAYKQEAALSKIYSLLVSLNADEQRRKRIIEQELQGNALPGKHDADADHLFEASKYSGYFITHDQRILKKAGKLAGVLPPSLTVVTLAQFLEIFGRYEAASVA